MQLLTRDFVHSPLLAICHWAIGSKQLSLIRARRCFTVDFMDSHKFLRLLFLCWARSNNFKDIWRLKSIEIYFSILQKRRLRNEVLLLVEHYLFNIFVCSFKLSTCTLVYSALCILWTVLLSFLKCGSIQRYLAPFARSLVFDFLCLLIFWVFCLDQRNVSCWSFRGLEAIREIFLIFS